MKTILLLLALIFSNISSFAQSEPESKKEHFLILSLGPAIPVGDFSETYSGAALIGVNATLEYIAFLNKQFGVGLSTGFRMNGLDEEGFTNLAQQGSGQNNINLDSEAWRTQFVAAAFVLKGDVSSQSFIYTKLNLGISFNKSASITTASGFSVLQSAKANSRLAGAAFGLRHQSGKLGVGAEIGALLNRPTFEMVFAGQKAQPITQPMNTINASITISHLIR